MQDSDRRTVAVEGCRKLLGSENEGEVGTWCSVIGYVGYVWESETNETMSVHLQFLRRVNRLWRMIRGIELWSACISTMFQSCGFGDIQSNRRSCAITIPKVFSWKVFRWSLGCEKLGMLLRYVILGKIRIGKKCFVALKHRDTFDKSRSDIFLRPELIPKPRSDTVQQ